MGELRALRPDTDHEAVAIGKPATISVLENAHCGLCGKALNGHALKFRMVSPLVTGSAVTVCHTCRMAAIGEGYRPAD
jgi:hypothetical protein